MDFGSFFMQIAQAMLLPLILGGVALLFPYQKTAVMRPLTPEELKAVQKQSQLSVTIGMVLWFAAIALITWQTYDCLKTLYQLLPKPSDDFSHTFVFDDLYWLFPALAIGIGVGSPVVVSLGRKYYGPERYALLNHAYNQLYGYDGEVVLHWLIRLVIGAGIAGIIMFYSTYAGIKGREVVINKLLEVRERRYPFGQLTRLTYVDYRVAHQHSNERWPFYEMEFTDGFVWNTREALRNMPIEDDQRIIEYLSQQTGIRIDTVQRIRQSK